MRKILYSTKSKSTFSFAISIEFIIIFENIDFIFKNVAITQKKKININNQARKKSTYIVYFRRFFQNNKFTQNTRNENRNYRYKKTYNEIETNC